MAEIDAVQLGLVRDALQRASDVGETCSREQLQRECGIGAGDLDVVLTKLREDGDASEVEPDGWRLGIDDAAPDVTPEPEMSLDEAEAAAAGGPAPIPGRPRQAPPEGEDVRVEMSLMVAQAVGKEGLGGIVEAGIAEAQEKGASFVFVIEP